MFEETGGIPTMGRPPAVPCCSLLLLLSESPCASAFCPRAIWNLPLASVYPSRVIEPWHSRSMAAGSASCAPPSMMTDPEMRIVWPGVGPEGLEPGRFVVPAFPPCPIAAWLAHARQPISMLCRIHMIAIVSSSQMQIYKKPLERITETCAHSRGQYSTPFTGRSAAQPSPKEHALFRQPLPTA